MKSEPFNVVIYPPPMIRRKAIAISNVLKRRGGMVALGDGHLPHLSVYIAEFPLKNVNRIRALLRQCAREISPFPVRSRKYRQGAGGYVDVLYQRSGQIRKIQMKIINLLNPMREHLIREKDRARMKTYSRGEQRNIVHYGFRSVGAEFSPHLTLTKLADRGVSVIPEIPPGNFSFQVEQLAFCRLGNHGTCRKVIEIYRLSRNRRVRYSGTLR